MGIITRVQRQTLVYWAYTGADLYGQPTYASGVQMTCRWDDRIKEIFDETGSPVRTEIELITRTRLQPKGLVWKGKLAQFTGVVKADVSRGIHEILIASSTPNFRNTETLFEAWA